MILLLFTTLYEFHFVCYCSLLVNYKWVSSQIPVNNSYYVHGSSNDQRHSFISFLCKDVSSPSRRTRSLLLLCTVIDGMLQFIQTQCTNKDTMLGYKLSRVLPLSLSHSCYRSPPFTLLSSKLSFC